MSSFTFQLADPASCKLNIGECARLALCRRDDIDLAMRQGQLRFYRCRGERFVDPPDLRAWMLTRSGSRQHGK